MSSFLETKQQTQATTIENLRLETGWKVNALLIKETECTIVDPIIKFYIFDFTENGYTKTLLSYEELFLGKKKSHTSGYEKCFIIVSYLMELNSI